MVSIHGSPSTHGCYHVINHGWINVLAHAQMGNSQRTCTLRAMDGDMSNMVNGQRRPYKKKPLTMGRKTVMNTRSDVTTPATYT